MSGTEQSPTQSLVEHQSISNKFHLYSPEIYIINTCTVGACLMSDNILFIYKLNCILKYNV